MTISTEISYQEAYHEMRRYRDKQQDYAKWFVSICLAIFAGIIATASQANGIELLQNVKIHLIFMILLFSIITTYQIQYMDDRYHEIRNKISFIEPDWKSSVRKSTIIKPTQTLIIQIVILTLFLISTIYTVLK